MNAQNPGDASQNYVLRFTERARRDLEALAVDVADRLGDDAAREWIAAFEERFASLAVMPRRYAEPSDRKGLSGDVRHVPFSRTPGSASYRLIYRVTETTPDGPLVELIHLRPATAKPLTPKEAREIEAQSHE